MPEVVQRRSSPRAPWVLPVILAVLIALLVLGVIFGKRIKDAMSSPTSTPVTHTVVVTATPGGPTATPAPGGAPATATPGSGASTPLPHATPIPTVPGLTLGMITRPQHEVSTVQAAADANNGTYIYHLDPRKVVQTDLPHYGFTNGFQVVEPNPSPTPTPYTGQDGRPLVKFVVSYQSKEYTVFVVQPATRGPKGIWEIATILPGRQ